MPTFNGTPDNDTLTGTSEPDIINGLAGDDDLFGLEGNDQLDGGEGADTMDGGAGDDLFLIDNALDEVIESGNQFDGSNDQLVTSVNYTLAAGVWVETLRAADGTASIFIRGNEVAQTLYGNSGDNLLVGGGGLKFEGFLAIGDTFIGGAGRDTYVVAQEFDRIVEIVGEGDDVVLALADYGLRPGVSVEAMVAAEGTEPIDLSGNELAQSIYGNAGNNVIQSGGGVDYLVGGAGHDIYFVSSLSIVSEDADGGDDSVRTTNASFTLSANIERLQASWAGFDGTTDPVNLTGNDLANEIIGNRGNNLLKGGAGDDILYGVMPGVQQDGNDLLNGGLGADQMRGGPGNDTYIIDNAGDLVIERSGEGDDIISTFISYSLLPDLHVETLAAQDGAGAIQLTGNSMGQSLYGNSSANTLNGADGDDFLVGLGGNDWLIGGQGSGDAASGSDNLAGGQGNDLYYVDSTDRILESANEGDDLAVAFTSFAVGAGQSVETIAAVDSAGAVALTGNELAQSLYGNASGNVLDGGAGNDHLVGGGGSDRFVFAGSPGNDSIGDFSSGTDKIDLSAYHITMNEISASNSGSNTVLSIDSNDDGTSDFTITLIGAGAPAAGDYVL
jgi:Ca2+-binding RTX toxin-like protein